jgi:hypothetical protein
MQLRIFEIYVAKGRGVLCEDAEIHSENGTVR